MNNINASDKKNNSIYFNIISGVIIFTCIIAVVGCLFNDTIIEGYSGIFLLPIVYLFFFLTVINIMRIKDTGCTITVSIYLFIQWLRLVVSPFAGVTAGYFSVYDSYVRAIDAEYALSLMLWETIVASSFCIVLLNIKKRKNDNYQIKFKLMGTRSIYIFFVLVGVVLFILTGADYFHFFTLDLSEERVATTLLNEGAESGAVISYALTFCMILLLFYCYKKYNATQNKKYVFFALGCSVFRLCLISSEGRLSQVYLLGTYLMLLPCLFPKYKKIIKKYIIIIATVVIALMTVYKTFYAFLYDSYIDAIKANSLDMNLIASQLDVYFYGLKTVSRNVAFSKQAELSVFQPVFDFVRNTFGMHYLIKNLNYTTVEYYNIFMYGNMTLSGHLFSSVAYGFLHFGFILSPMVACFNLITCCLVERIIGKIRYIDVYYVVSIAFIRLLMTIFWGFGPSWNMVSRNLCIGFAIIILSSAFKRKH